MFRRIVLTLLAGFGIALYVPFAIFNAVYFSLITYNTYQYNKIKRPPVVVERPKLVNICEPIIEEKDCSDWANWPIPSVENLER